MKIRDLAEYCKSICIDCENCTHATECDNLQNELEDASPFSVVDMVDRDVDLAEEE